MSAWANHSNLQLEYRRVVNVCLQLLGIIFQNIFYFVEQLNYWVCSQKFWWQAEAWNFLLAGRLRWTLLPFRCATTIHSVAVDRILNLPFKRWNFITELTLINGNLKGFVVCSKGQPKIDLFTGFVDILRCARVLREIRFLAKRTPHTALGQLLCLSSIVLKHQEIRHKRRCRSSREFIAFMFAFFYQKSKRKLNPTSTGQAEKNLFFRDVKC